MRRGSYVEFRVSTVWQLKSSRVNKTNIFVSLLTVLRKYLTLVCLSFLMYKMIITISTPHMFSLRIIWDNVIETIRTESNTVRSHVNSRLASGQKWEGKMAFFPFFSGYRWEVSSYLLLYNPFPPSSIPLLTWCPGCTTFYCRSLQWFVIYGVITLQNKWIPFSFN